MRLKSTATAASLFFLFTVTSARAETPPKHEGVDPLQQIQAGVDAVNGRTKTALPELNNNRAVYDLYVEKLTEIKLRLTRWEKGYNQSVETYGSYPYQHLSAALLSSRLHLDEELKAMREIAKHFDEKDGSVAEQAKDFGHLTSELYNLRSVELHLEVGERFNKALKEAKFADRLAPFNNTVLLEKLANIKNVLADPKYAVLSQADKAELEQKLRPLVRQTFYNNRAPILKDMTDEVFASLEETFNQKARAKWPVPANDRFQLTLQAPIFKSQIGKIFDVATPQELSARLHKQWDTTTEMYLEDLRPYVGTDPERLRLYGNFLKGDFSKP